MRAKEEGHRPVTKTWGMGLSKVQECLGGLNPVRQRYLRVVHYLQQKFFGIQTSRAGFLVWGFMATKWTEI
jgi:hypothetical protein